MSCLRRILQALSRPSGGLVPRQPKTWLALAGCVLATALVRAQTSDGQYVLNHSTQTTGRTQEPITILPTPVFIPSFCDPGPMQVAGGASEQRERLLDKEGPQQLPLYSMSYFSVMGFSRGGWPIVIDYFLEADSLIIAVIAPEGREPMLFRLQGKKGHWQSRLQIPESAGKQLQVSQYLVQAIDDKTGQVNPAHIHIHGIAAGPQAVGSLGIDQVDFGPDTIHTARREKAQFAFHSIYDFPQTEVSFIRLGKVNGEIIAARIGSKKMGHISKGDLKRGDWDGRSDGGGDAAKKFDSSIQQWLRQPTGQHIIQVKAWLGASEGGDWVTALSEDLVEVD